MPRRLSSRVESLEHYSTPSWLPVSEYPSFQALPRSWKQFLNGFGGTPDMILTLLAALPQDKRQAVIARLQNRTGHA